MGSDDKHHPKEVKLPSGLKPHSEYHEFEPTDAKQEQMIEDFIAAHKANSLTDPVQQRYTNFFTGNWHTIAHKFLVARKWNAKDASDMYNYAMNFRGRMRFHERPFWPPAIKVRGYDLDDVARLLPDEPVRSDAWQIDPATGKYINEWDRIASACGTVHNKSIHYWDKTGHPVIIDRFPSKHKEYVELFKGALAPQRTVLEAWEDYHWHFSEVCGIVMKYQNIKRGAEFGGAPITKASVIMDCCDVSYGLLFSDMFKLNEKVWAEDGKVIPEGAHRIFIVNSPSLITIGFKLLKHIIPKRTQERFVFCSKENTTAALLTAIDADKLPKVFGGTCECPGGCL